MFRIRAVENSNVYIPVVRHIYSLYAPRFAEINNGYFHYVT